MKVYVVIESSWNGYNYSADEANVFSKKEDAERYKEYLEKNFNADVSAFIDECEVDDISTMVKL